MPRLFSYCEDITMSTRASYTFKDEDETFHVYKHHDGYPSGAVRWIEAAVSKAWELPRFEASDFGAAFIAANKKNGGGVRLMHSGEIKDVAPSDIEYRYEIEAKKGVIYVAAFKTKYWGEPRTDKYLWNGALSAMKKWVNLEQEETE
jgi:hypothetical protein